MPGDRGYQVRGSETVPSKVKNVRNAASAAASQPGSSQTAPGEHAGRLNGAAQPGHAGQVGQASIAGPAGPGRKPEAPGTTDRPDRVRRQAPSRRRGGP